MMFSQDRKTDTQGKQGSLMGFLFKPDISGSIRPITESTNMFVKLIAMIFAMNKLFPSDHPALRDEKGARLTLGEVVGTAWQNVSFTREGLPRALLFFAVVGCLVFSALFVLTFGLSLLVGTAHAAGTGTNDGMFSTPDETNDIAHNILGYLFKGKDLSALAAADVSGSFGRVPQSQGIQNALKTALGFYSSGILVFAGFVLLYHLLEMIVETAHTGKPMGNANQIWAPIRLVFAIGLLVPVANGLNTGQYIAIQMADWGSGFASQAWTKLLTEVAKGNDNYVPPPVPELSQVVRGLAAIQACVYTYNSQIQILYKDNPARMALALIPANGTKATGADGRDIVTFGNYQPGMREFCGKYSLPNTTVIPANSTVVAMKCNGTSGCFDSTAKNLSQAIIQNNIDVLNSVWGEIQTSIYVNMDYFIRTTQLGNQTEIQPNNDIAFLAKSYYDQLKAKNTALFSGADTTVTKLANDWSKFGWLAAGAWFNAIARTQSAVYASSQDSLPYVQAPMLDIDDGEVGLDTPESIAITSTRKFMEWSEMGYSKAATVSKADMDTMGRDASFGKPKEVDSPFLLDLILKGLDLMGGKDKSWYITIGQTANPLAEIAALGFQSIDKAFILLDSAAVAAGGADMAKALTTKMGQVKTEKGKAALTTIDFLAGQMKSATGMYLSIVIIVSTLLLTVGITLGFVLPLLPFTLFFFNALAWLLSVFEAVVSMPLLALAHLTTGGPGLPGSMAKQGYFYLFAIFLRPVLMVFGLVAGMLIFFVALAILNMTFKIAAVGTGMLYSTGGFVKLSMIIFQVLYSMMVYICANTCFKTINFFPEHGLRWMGTSGPATERMGDKQLMSTAAQGITAYAVRDTLGSTLQKNPGLIATAMGANHVIRNENAGGGTPELPKSFVGGPKTNLDNQLGSSGGSGPSNVVKPGDKFPPIAKPTENQAQERQLTDSERRTALMGNNIGPASMGGEMYEGPQTDKPPEQGKNALPNTKGRKPEVKDDGERK